jgi:DNA polymerase-3 subunit alpha
MSTLDAALASADQQARAANQNSLFGIDDADAALTAKMADVPRWRLREQLAQEKLSLGFYLGGHPYQEYAAELGNFVKHKLSDITPGMVQPKAGNGGYTKRVEVKLVLGGIVSSVRILQTRRGKMAVVTLDDGSAPMEVTVFSDLYDLNRPWIKDDELLVVRGKASYDEYSGGMRVTAEEVFDFASARATFAKRLEIACSINAPVGVPQMAEILKPFCGGKCPVVIHYSNLLASVPLRLGETWQVTLPDMLINDLRALLGIENVRIVYGND